MEEKVIHEVRVIETEDGFRIEIKGDKEQIKAFMQRLALCASMDLAVITGIAVRGGVVAPSGDLARGAGTRKRSRKHLSVALLPTRARTRLAPDRSIPV
jgi:hypothetical protein